MKDVDLSQLAKNQNKPMIGERMTIRKGEDIYYDAIVHDYGITEPLKLGALTSITEPEKETINGYLVLLTADQTDFITINFSCVLSANCNIGAEDLIRTKCIHYED